MVCCQWLSRIGRFSTRSYRLVIRNWFRPLLITAGCCGREATPPWLSAICFAASQTGNSTGRLQKYPPMSNYFRIVSGTAGIFEVVDRDCPSDDPRRSEKPDGAWLPKVGLRFEGAISFWTETGLNRYMECGLFRWHASVVRDRPSVLCASIQGPALYSDPYQVICHPRAAHILTETDWEVFLAQRNEKHNT